MTNFIVNARRHAFPRETRQPRGTILITARRVDENVALKITDNGAGIKAKLLPRIFDPFVTTKRGDGGTGLGLPIVFNLVNYRLKGRVEVTNIKGSGAEFRRVFPAQLEPISIEN